MEPPLSPSTQARVAVPFAIVTLLWSTTWLVIRDQVHAVPPGWSISYRFIFAAAAMLVYVVATRQPLRLGRVEHCYAFGFGLFQVMLNFNFVYRAEKLVTSGLVALLFALLIVPNSLFAWLLFGQGLSRRFLAGSAIAMLGIALLFAHELEASAAGSHAVALGIGLTLLAVLSASITNVMQISPRARAISMPSLIAWGSLWGVLLDSIFAWTTEGAPAFDPRPGYWLGAAYLGIFASALAFLLHFRIIRAIGPGRAAYSSVLIPVFAMALSTLFEDYRWSWPAAIGAALTVVGLVVALDPDRSRLDQPGS